MEFGGPYTQFENPGLMYNLANLESRSLLFCFCFSLWLLDSGSLYRKEQEPLREILEVCLRP